MNIPKEHEQEFARFPAVLRGLVIAELAAGNAIAEFAHGYPAAPCGAYIKLARPVTSRPRVQTPELDFYDRNESDYSGEFTDAKRHFFVLEPPHPPEPESDMNALRAARDARQRANDDDLIAQTERETNKRRAESKRRPLPRAGASSPPLPLPPATGSPLVERFRASMVMNYEKWHDGISYGLDLIQSATPEECAQIEQLLLSGGVEDWRDVEALAALDSPRARAAIQAAIDHSNAKVRAAVMRYATGLIPDRSRVTALVRSLREARLFGGLSQTLDEVAAFHPPEIVEALLQGALEREGEVAVHFAAMLAFLHCRAAEPFDMEQRQFFLRFNTEDRGERKAAYRELCALIGVDATRWLTGSTTSP